LKKKFLPPAFPKIHSDYLRSWDIQFNHFFKKISNISSCRNIGQYYKILRARIRIPNKFILSHSDISPKHLFSYKSKIGCVDLEDSMYLDASYMWALWYVRTIHQRNRLNKKQFLNEFFLRNLNLNLFNFHIYRELFIQYYYQGLLDNFFRDYFKFLKNFSTFIKT
jgi:hypothetical protein